MGNVDGVIHGHAKGVMIVLRKEMIAAVDWDLWQLTPYERDIERVCGSITSQLA